MKEIILAISGKPGLFQLVSRGRSTLVVETLDEQKRRSSVSLRDRISSLNDISIYTDDEDVRLMNVFESIRVKYKGQPVGIDARKATKEQLGDFLAEVLPNYDRDRVYPGDIKKIILWYNILVKGGYTDFLVPEEGSEEAEAQETAAE